MTGAASGVAIVATPCIGVFHAGAFARLAVRAFEAAVDVGANLPRRRAAVGAGQAGHALHVAETRRAASGAKRIQFGREVFGG